MIIAATAALVLSAQAGLAAAWPRPPVPPLLSQGLAQRPCTPQDLTAVPARSRARFVPGSSVLRPSGAGAGGPACAAAAVAASRAWLASGIIPGVSAAQRSMATQALLDLRLLTRPDGAVLAGWSRGWAYAWPRDSSWVAAALAATGHSAQALRILEFLRRMQSRDGTWAARYWPDGSGPVRDGRPAELDAVGWVPWAVWSWYTAPGPGHRDATALAGLWPMVTAAADAARRSLARGGPLDGLPAASMDYWEDSVQVTLGTAAALRTGLRAAADLAGLRGDEGQARAWAAAAARLTRAIGADFGGYGYHRLPFTDSGTDAAVTFLGPPFAAPASRMPARESAAGPCGVRRAPCGCPAGACCRAAAGLGTAPWPGPRRPRSSRCMTRPPGSAGPPPGSCPGWPPTAPGWVSWPSRSAHAGSPPRSPRWPGPTPSCCWPWPARTTGPGRFPCPGRAVSVSRPGRRSAGRTCRPRRWFRP